MRRVLFASVALLGALQAQALDPNACDAPGETPDVIAASIDTVVRSGTVGGTSAYTIGVTDCNVGSCWADFFAFDTRHPVIGQNLFRLEDGRFEQVGQAWVKHTFFALSSSLCFADCQPTDGTHLGVHCSDPNSASSQGYQAQLGPKHEVNVTSGEFPFPFGAQNQSGNAIYKRLQVRDEDVDPASHPAASFVFEAQYVARDDAAAGNGANNASYRRATVSTAGGVPTFALSGPTERNRCALQAWRAADPEVVETVIDVPGDGRFFVGARVTDQGGGLWRYEYAIQNLTSHRSAGAFAVPLLPGGNVTGAGFHDVAYHSESSDGTGSYYDGTDWPLVVSGSEMRWATTSAAVDPRANALRWGTLYNFRFTADVPPVAGTATLGLFLPGLPEAVPVPTLVPRTCDLDGTCEPGETRCSCPADCGLPPASESACDDGLDDDCDHRADCADGDCCAADACAGPDADGDSYAGCDCDPIDPAVWLPPGPIGSLVLSRPSADIVKLSWDPPSEPGATSLTYSVLRSVDPGDFMSGATCLPGADPAATTATDADLPGAGGPFYYLVRGVNGCPDGVGSLGRDSDQVPREGRVCP